ncbi:MAG: transporter [Bdellovibrionales bacterium]|nr:transporter [Bdellovibrionales bacterium]
MLKFISALFVSVFIGSQIVYAGGFALQEQSAEGVGSAFAGATAGFGDGSSIFYNPAAMSAIEGTQFSFSGHVVSTSADFTNTGSSLVPALGGSAVAGSNGGDAGGTFFIPNIYAIHPINEKLTFGFGINSPFGLETNHDAGWVGRYQALKSELTVVNLNPALAYELTDNFSVGAGLRVMYIDATLTNAVDFGSVGASTLGLPTASSLGLLPQAADGHARVEGDDWATGFTLGGNYRYGDNNKNSLGVSWRSKASADLKGDAKFTVPTNALALTSTGSFTDTNVTAGVTLPEAISAGWRHWLTDDFAILAETEWTRWSRFDELRVKFASGQADSVTEENWENTWRFALGALYQATDDLVLRAGWSFDESPIPDDAHRTPRIPGNDRNWLAMGLGYKLTEDLSANLSYAHIFVKDGSSSTAGSTGDIFVGDWDAEVNIVSANIVWNLG